MNYSTDINAAPTYFPKQKIAESKKTEKWHIENCKAAIDTCQNTDDSFDSIRLDKYEMYVNRNLARGDMDPRDLSLEFNPLGLESLKDSFREVRNYPIEAEFFNLLIGESSQREFNFVVAALDNEINNKRSQRIIDELKQFTMQAIENQDLNEDQIKQELDEKIGSLNYNMLEIEEIKANQLIEYISKFNNFDEMFVKSHWDLFEVAEEVVRFSNRGGQLYVEKAHPEDIYTIRSGDSAKYEDSDVIVEVTYKPPFTVIDDYKDKLTDADMRKIDETYSKEKTGNGANMTLEGFSEEDSGIEGGSIFDLDKNYELNSNGIGADIRSNGDLRVVRVCWKSFREVYILTRENDDGSYDKEFVDANYVVNSENGETVEKIYIPEWREATQIMGEIYVDMGPFFGNKYSKQDMKLVGHPYIGYIYSISGSHATCLMSQIKNYKYLYNVIREEMTKAIGRNIGNVMELDTAYMPDDYTLEQVLYYMKNANIKLVDSFSTDPDDPSGNIRAGNYNTTGKMLDVSQVNHIQLYSTILEDLKSNIGALMGVTPQRLGQVSSRETKGGIERSVVQSSNTTEIWFKTHDEFKKRVYTNSMELGQLVYDGESIIVQNTSDDFMSNYITLNTEDIVGYDFGLFVSDSQKDMRTKETFEQMAPIMFQNQLLDVGEYAKIMDSSSPAQTKKVYQNAQLRNQREKQEAQQSAMEQQKAQSEEAARLEQNKNEFELRLKQLEYENKLLIEELGNKNNIEVQMLKNQESGGGDALAKHSAIINERKQSLAESAQQSKERLAQEELQFKKQQLKLNQNRGK